MKLAIIDAPPPIEDPAMKAFITFHKLALWARKTLMPIKWVIITMIVCSYIWTNVASIHRNSTPSLPYRYFIIIHDSGKNLKRGDIVAFSWNGLYPFYKGRIFTKHVMGLPGDDIKVVGRSVFINGKYLSTGIEEAPMMGKMIVGYSGIIPNGFFYAHGTHPLSFDSRYGSVGLIQQSDIIGHAIPIM